MTDSISIPTRHVGPVFIVGEGFNDPVKVPLSTYETPLWPSVNRGAKLARQAGGIHVTVMDDRMTRSVVVQAKSAQEAFQLKSFLAHNIPLMQECVRRTSRFAQLIHHHTQIVGDLIYIRFEFTTGDAAGHNMTTKAADALLKWILEQCPYLTYVSISGNLCTDKKVSAINGILGRGKNVVAEVLIPEALCVSGLKTTPQKIVDLNTKKNLIGSILSGGVRSANAHYANILLAFYLATGQDAANIVEGSQGITFTEVRDDRLYFSVTCPNVIVGTVGNGKDLPFVRDHLTSMGCLESRAPGENAKRLAAIAVATVLCSELSLLAAQTNVGELIAVHERLERLPQKKVRETLP